MKNNRPTRLIQKSRSDEYDFDFGLDTESDYSEGSEADDSSYISSDDEDACLTETNTMPRSSSANALSNMEMSAYQLAVLFGQMRTEQAKRNSVNEATNPTPTRRVPLKTSPPRTFRPKPVKHIQGEAMPTPVRRNSIESFESLNSGLSLETPDIQHPLEFFKDIVAGVKMEFKTFKPAEVERFFLAVTPDRVNSYNNEVTGAIRTSNIDALRSLHQKGYRMDGCNRFGESVLHLACRRGSPQVLKFLVEEARVDLRVRDDYGRSPMHDACWTSEPNMVIIKILVSQWPDLLLVEDKRGFTPLQYVRGAKCWREWVKFMTKHRKKFIPKALLSAHGKA